MTRGQARNDMDRSCYTRRELPVNAPASCAVRQGATGNSLGSAIVKTSLGIWAFGNMATRFNAGGYKPELSRLPTAAKVRTAVEGLGDLMDDYEFHYPQELSRDNLEEVQQALDGHGI